MKAGPFTAALAAAALLLIDGAAAQAVNDPRATLQRYMDAVNSANYPELVAVLSDEITAFSYVDCTPQMTPKQCLATFVNNTMLKRHGSMNALSMEVTGDTVVALVEVRHDGTRAAGVPRMLGTDTVTVKNNKIVSLDFKMAQDDPSNKKILAARSAQAGAAAAR